MLTLVKKKTTVVKRVVKYNLNNTRLRQVVALFAILLTCAVLVTSCLLLIYSSEYPFIVC